MSKVVWLSRDPGFVFGYELHTKKPRKQPDGDFDTKTRIEIFCNSHFERITGFTLAPGECKRVRIRVEDV